ncbi:MAG: prephenate dehydrogenase [Flavobacteriaceae bacterium CG1_02_35_72]|nr:MAG: prephenate dehydrogenase [Flavobacteriaceae bacterium CG1_02_35_72]
MEKIVVFGLGLIGGSMALSLKQKNRCFIGVDPNKAHAQKALELGIIDEIGSLKEAVDAQIIIIAVPVNVAPELTLKILDLIDEQALVFDVGSVKTSICEAVKHHPKRFNFVAAHPIAGTEFSGPTAAFNGLFRGKKNIICEPNQTAQVILQSALSIFKELEMSTSFMEAKAHDKHIAYVSHLSHISSFMLGKTVLEIEKDEASIFTMAGSGFASTVRLSKSSPETWTPIFIQNKNNILKSLDEYIKNLNQFRELLYQHNTEAIYQAMKDTHKLKKILEDIK